MPAPRPDWTLIGELAQIRACSSCGRHVLTCRTDGIVFRADPENLTVAGELIARLDNRLTFDAVAVPIPRGLRLLIRDIFRIRAERKHAILAQHRCGAVIPAAHTEPWQHIAAVAKPSFPAIPPF